MMRRFWAALVGAVAVVVATAWSAAAEEPRTPQTYAVLVGVGQYQDKDITPRPHAEDDVKALYDLVVDKGHFNAAPDHVKLLLGTADAKRNSEPATRANVLKAVKWLRDSAKTDDEVVFAFFGSGGPAGEGGARRCYFVSDSTVKDRATNAVSANELGDDFDKLKSQRLAVFLDVNFKSINAEPPLEVSLGDPPYKEFLGDDGTPEHAPLAGRVMFMATNGLSPGTDVKDQSLFGKALVDGLKGAADKDGYEPDGAVTTEELASWLDKELPKLKRDLAPDAKRTLHFVIGSAQNRFVLTASPEGHAKAEKLLAKFDEAVKAQKVPQALADEGRGLLEKMPKLEARQSLRKEYQKFAEGGETLEQLQANRDKLLESMKLTQAAARDFTRKVMQAVDLVDQAYIKETNPGELVTNAVRGLYRRLDEPVPEDVSDKLAKAKKMTLAELTQLLIDVRTRLGKREDLDEHKDVDIALQRMLSPLDPYTTYVGPADKARFEIDLKAEYSGIGAQIRKDENTDMVRIVTPIKGGPAYKLGIESDDLIEKIVREMDSDGVKLPKTEVLDTKDMTLTEVVKKLLGKSGTKVHLTMRRGDKTLEYDVERGPVKQETVVGFKRLADDSWDYMIDPEKKIGYVRLISFAPNTATDLKAAVATLKKQGMKSLIFDLRFNPGGMLNIARDVADLFINDEEIVSIRPRTFPGQKMVGRAEGSELDFPMVCLVNGGSASASEIVSACLQDHDRAKICGSRSYGKGSVQNVQPFDGGDLKLTIATFWRPSGKNLNKLSTEGKDEDEWGVKPDKQFELVLPKGEEDALAEALHNQEVIRKDKKTADKPFKDRQLEMAVEYLKKK